MTTIRKVIGRLPMLIGEWQSNYREGQGYMKNNRVLIFNSELQSKIDNNTYVPATYNSETGVITFDTTHWIVVNDGRSTIGLDEKLAEKYVKPVEGIPATDLAFTPATLTDGKIPEEQLPSYVDDVIELLDITDTAPATCTKGDYYYNTSTGKIVRATGTNTWGTSSATNTNPESSKIYIDLSDSNKSYRWSGSTMVPISAAGITGIKVGASGSTIEPSNGVITIPAYETGAQVHIAPTTAEVKSALNTVTTSQGKYLKDDGTWDTPAGGSNYESKSAVENGTDVSLVTTGEKYAWNQKQDVITDGAQIGLGLGVSTEAATVNDRTATISNFILLKNMPVAITFNNAINVTAATLNISSTGAKPIFIKGAALQAGVVKAGDVVTLVYDGTNWNIIDILTVDVSASDLYVDMGLPSGTLWAKANIDVTTQSGFAEVDSKPSPFKYECSFFSWGNTEGHNPISESAFDYDWGSSNNGPYAQTPGAALTADAGLSFDAARANLGAPWRDPSTEDFAELFNNIDFVQADGETVIDASQTNKLVTVNNVVGIYLKSKINSRLLFFACSSGGDGQSWNLRGSDGYYWSRSLYSQANGRYLYFSGGAVGPQYYSNRFYGFARRAVQ